MLHTLVLADDHPAFLEGVSMKLEREEGLEVVATASNGREALEVTLNRNPDLLLVDMDMPVMSGLDVVRELHRRETRTKLLPLSGHADPEYVLGTLENGAEGYLMKDESLSTIVGAIRKVLGGGVFISDRVSQQLVAGRLREGTREYRKQRVEEILIAKGVTPRLLGILLLAAQGLNNKEIAKEVYRSEHTVRNQIDTLKKLLDVRWRPAIVAWAWKVGIQEIDTGEYEDLYRRTDLIRRSEEDDLA